MVELAVPPGSAARFYRVTALEWYNKGAGLEWISLRGVLVSLHKSKQFKSFQNILLTILTNVTDERTVLLMQAH